jgi:predicted DNA-binding transcriptional regulator AlpA
MERKNMSVKLLDRDGLAAKGITWNASTLWRKTTSGEFPKAVIIGNKNHWLETEVDDYIANLIAKRDAVPAGEARKTEAA